MGTARAGGQLVSWPRPHTELREVLLVVKAAGRLPNTLEVHLALVAHAVHIGGSICPRHAGYTSACLHIPATDVRHAACLPFPAWEDRTYTSRQKCLKAEPSPVSPPCLSPANTHRLGSPIPSQGLGPLLLPERCPSVGFEGAPVGDSVRPCKRMNLQQRTVI